MVKRARFRSVWLSAYAGSSPAIRIYHNLLIARRFLFIMVKRGLLITIFILVVIIILLQFQFKKPSETKANITVEIIAQNLRVPWSIDFLPGGRMIFTERSGQVSILDDGQPKVVGEIDISEISESGLLGIAVDPEFVNNKFIYLYYTHDKGNQVSRFVLNEKLEDEFILLDNIPSAQFHDGGRIKFGPDGKLYITTGDATIPSSAQDINSLAGKILRTNKDGTIPEDNPFGNYVYSYGHRNPQGLAWHPTTKELYASEHGPIRNDEINLIKPGKNYGWPTEECQAIKYQAPLRCYSEFTLAPGGAAFLDNELFVAGLRGSQLRRITFAADGTTIISEEALLSNLGRIRDVVEYQGALYIATSNRDGRGVPRKGDDKILKIVLK